MARTARKPKGRRSTSRVSSVDSGSRIARTAAGRHVLTIPRDEVNVHLNIAGKMVRLSNLNKPFWPELGITKGDLLQYYADVSPVLLPHLKDRAMVMRRYPDGAYGQQFFMK